MLNNEYIHSKICDPASCYSEDANKMRELTELFPYASSFSVLYLKTLSNSGDVRLESELEKLAFRISARDILYNLLQSKEAETIEPIENNSDDNSSIETEIPSDNSNSSTRLLSAEKELENDCQTEEKEILITDSIQEELPIDRVAEDSFELDNSEIIEEKSDEQELETSILKESNLDDELDKIIVSAAISNSFVDQELSPIVSGISDVLSTPNETISVLMPESSEAEVSPLVIEQPIIETKISAEEIVAPKSFTAWLKVSKTKQEEHQEEEELTKAAEYYTFEKPKKEFFSPVKKAKESLDENKMPVSETLAKIFALQGNYSKAIYVYEQLTLLFPEKKSFFASQIRNLKKKINS